MFYRRLLDNFQISQEGVHLRGLESQPAGELGGGWQPAAPARAPSPCRLPTAVARGRRALRRETARRGRGNDQRGARGLSARQDPLPIFLHFPHYSPPAPAFAVCPSSVRRQLPGRGHVPRHGTAPPRPPPWAGTGPGNPLLRLSPPAPQGSAAALPRCLK